MQLLLLLLLVFTYFIGSAVHKISLTTQPTVKVKGKEVREALSMSQIITCYIPFYQMCVLRKKMFDSAVYPTALLSVVLLGIILRVSVFFLQIPNVPLLIASSILALLALVAAFLLYAVVVAEVAFSIDAAPWLKVLSVVLPFIAILFLTSPVSIRLHAEEDKIKGTFDAD